MLSVVVPLFFMSVMGFKLRLSYWLILAVVLAACLIGYLGQISLLPMLVGVFFMSPLLLAISARKWKGVLFGMVGLLPLFLQFIIAQPM